jgi:hypothetical protein
MDDVSTSEPERSEKAGFSSNLFFRINPTVNLFVTKLSFGYLSISRVYAVCCFNYIVSNFIYVYAEQLSHEYTPVLWFSCVVNTTTDVALFLFEYYTSREINRRLKVSSFSFNTFVLLFVASLALIDGYYFPTYESTPYIIFNVLYFSGFYPLFYINLTMTTEIIKSLDRVALKCCENENISLITDYPINPRPEAMRNTTKFYSRIKSLYKLLELKLIVTIILLIIVTVLNLLLPINQLAYYALIYSCRFLLALAQPLYFQFVIGKIETANGVYFECEWRIFGVDINSLIFVLPLLSFMLTLVKVVNS